MTELFYLNKQMKMSKIGKQDLVDKKPARIGWQADRIADSRVSLHMHDCYIAFNVSYSVYVLYIMKHFSKGLAAYMPKQLQYTVG